MQGTIRTPDCPLTMIEAVWYVITLFASCAVLWRKTDIKIDFLANPALFLIVLFYIVFNFGSGCLLPRFSCYGVDVEWGFEGLIWTPSPKQ
jgi:hypothetical protein